MTEPTDTKPAGKKPRRSRKSKAKNKTTDRNGKNPGRKKVTPVVDDAETFSLDQSFSDLGLPEEIQKALDERGFVHPTKIQAQLIPIALTGKDVLGQARTGTGKTAAFGLPALASLAVHGVPTSGRATLSSESS